MKDRMTFRLEGLLAEMLRDAGYSVHLVCWKLDDDGVGQPWTDHDTSVVEAMIEAAASE